ncbi:hypothetical protein C8J57DRAFT_1706469 [Mycena rebaudengoi]|nr:hypothetical protein C8J57DRAFT_1706469 [Mycena rebaudengoi]
MHAPSPTASSFSDYSSNSGDGHSISLHRVWTGGSSGKSIGSSIGSEKFRYSGRGGAGSRPRVVTNGLELTLGQTLKNGISHADANLSKCFKRASHSEKTPAVVPPVPTIPPSSLALRRGASNIPPLVLPPSPRLPSHMATPPLSSTASSFGTTSTTSEFVSTPHSPYFYFEDPPDVPAFHESQSPSSPGMLSRSLKRFASRTQLLFLKPPASPLSPSLPPLPHPLPLKLPAPAPPPAPTDSVRCPSQTSLALSQTSFALSEWYDPPESPTSPASSELPSSGFTISAAAVNSSTHTRSPSDATLVVPQRRKERVRRHKKPREVTACDEGEWNRDEMEVIVGLRMLR